MNNVLKECIWFDIFPPLFQVCQFLDKKGTSIYYNHVNFLYGLASKNLYYEM